MKKFFLMIALLVLAVPAFAANIPTSVDPKEGPEVWTTQVYNNSGSTLSAGNVVVWDTDAATGDNDNYVTTTTTAATHLVAGVVYPSAIAAGATGTIAVFGNGIPVTTTTGAVEGSALCTTTTAGGTRPCASTELGQMVGFCVANPSSGSCTAKVNIK